MDPDDVVTGSPGDVEEDAAVLHFLPPGYSVIFQNLAGGPEKTVVARPEVEVFLFFFRHGFPPG